MRRRILFVIVVGLLAVALVLSLRPPLFLVDPGEYETTTVSVHDTNGTQVSTVDVRIADTSAKRRVGLSRTDSLADGEGMLFVHDESDTHAYVMRNMAFPLDIVFVAENGTITRVHHAPVDGDGPYRGQGRYVLEVPRGWTSETGVGVGDEVRIPATVTDGG